MAQSYTRQSTFADGDTITAALFNNEYDQLVNAFSYSSTNSTTTGHRHDGTAGEGGNIGKIGDLDFLNKIEVDDVNNRWGVYVEVTGVSTEQVRFQDGSIVPVTTNDIDLGSGSLQFKDLFIDGTASIDSLALSSGSTVDVILDEDDLVSDSATALATQQSIKAYVDSQVTAQDLDVSSNTGTISIDLDSETLTFVGGTGIDTAAVGNDVLIAIDATVATLTDAQTLTNKTIDASLNTLSNIANASLTNSTVSYGGVQLSLGGVDATPAFDLVDATGYLGDSALVTTGALNSGSITSGFGSIDVGSSSITTLGTVSGGTLTGTLSTAAQVNVTSLGTLTSLAIAGDLTVDTSTLKVDSANNRVGILNAAPDVSLDIGSATDAVHVPVGTTAQRPGTPAAGYFRYNADLEQFEGYTDTWGAIGGGGTNTFTFDSFTGDNTTVDFVLSQATNLEGNLIVFIDGVFQTQDAYTIATASGITTLTFSAAPATGRYIAVYTIAAGVSGNNMNLDSFSGNGVTTDFTLSINAINENNTQIFIDGVYQQKDGYTVTNTTLSFSAAPPLNSTIEVMTFTQTEVNVPVDNSIEPIHIKAGDFYFDTDTLYIDSVNNRVGIGTASPAHPLQVRRAGGAGSLGINIDSVGSTDRTVQYFSIQDSATGAGAGHAFYYRPQGSATDTFGFMLDESGSVGIGTASPDALLDLEDTEPTIRLTDDRDISWAVNETLGKIEFYSSDTSGIGAHVTGFIKNLNAHASGTTQVAGALSFGVADYNTAAAEAMRIDSSGNAMFNTTDIDPAGNNVYGTALLQYGGASMSRVNTAAIQLNRSSSDGDIAVFRKDGTTVGSIGTVAAGAADQLYINSDDVGLRFRGSDDSIVPCTSAGAFRDAAVDLGKDTGRFKDLYLSGGAYLGGAVAANKLDDYEEGTWSPVYEPTTGSFASITMDTPDCVYVKVGNLVSVSGIIRTDAVDTTGGSGSLRIGGLPFTATRWSAANIGRITGFAGETPLAGYVGGNSTKVNLYFRTTADANTSPSQITDLTTGTNSDVNYMFFQCTYSTQ